MKYCPNCGKKVKEEQDVCLKCGVTINKTERKGTNFSSDGRIDRAKLKEAAKEKIRGKLWEIWKPTLIVMLLTSVLTSIFGFAFGGFSSNLEDSGSAFFSVVVQILSGPLSVGMILYVLNFIRGKKYDVSDLFKPFSNIIPILCVSLLTSALMVFGYILFIIPGIIITFGLSMVNYVLADGEMSITQVIKKSWNMMNGYKMDYFVFGLSFLGWVLLLIPTFGLLLIWLLPYIEVSTAMYYDELTKIKE